MLPAARSYGLGLIPWSPLHGGLLAGVLRKQREGGGSRGNSGRAADALEANRERIEAYEKLCADLGEDAANVGLAWLLHQDGVTVPIVGLRTAEHLDSSLRATEITLDTDVLEKLDQLFPPPARTAPGRPRRPTPGRRRVGTPVLTFRARKVLSPEGGRPAGTSSVRPFPGTIGDG